MEVSGNEQGSSCALRLRMVSALPPPYVQGAVALRIPAWCPPPRLRDLSQKTKKTAPRPTQPAGCAPGPGARAHIISQARCPRPILMNIDKYIYISWSLVLRITRVSDGKRRHENKKWP